MSSRILRIGTRGSLLAVTQCEWVAEQIERRNPGVRTELVRIETEGDRIKDIPLSQIPGQSFFVKEIDAALLSDRIDVSVHSAKDLALERPEGIRLAAYPPREDAHDIAFFRPDIMDVLRRDGTALKVGTSAPRRLENTPAFLAEALPRFEGSPPPKMEFVQIRGNVNTRLARLNADPSDDRHLDAVVLSLAGFLRLSRNPDAWKEVRPLVADKRFMVLPYSDCPTAPAQGALAVECRSGDEEAFALLNRLDDPDTDELLRLERGVLVETGGGCHQRFGATAVRVPRVGAVMQVRGTDLQGNRIDRTEWKSPPPPEEDAVRAWDGTHHRNVTVESVPKSGLPTGPEHLGGRAVFAAHSRAVPESWNENLDRCRVWTSGPNSWKRLADRGVWVEGCAEGLGYRWLRPLLDENLFELPAARDWVVLTHDQAADSWTEEEVVATYHRRPLEFTDDHESVTELQAATHVYWGSASQYRQLGKYAGPDVHHACGPGKTADAVPEVTVFPSAGEWRKWVHR